MRRARSTRARRAPAISSSRAVSPRATIEELRRRGHQVEVVGDWSLGRMTAAARDGDVLKAAANPRLMQNYAIGR